MRRNVKELANAGEIVMLSSQLQLLNSSTNDIKQSKKITSLIASHETEAIKLVHEIMCGINSMILTKKIDGTHSAKSVVAFYNSFNVRGHILARRWPSWSSMTTRYLDFIQRSQFTEHITDLNAESQFLDYLRYKDGGDSDDILLLMAYLAWQNSHN
ncbi:MAG: hypothetical protein SOZ13_07700 [Enterococcus avium]|nr:hypothetical protein [Enterococcus avium]